MVPQGVWIFKPLFSAFLALVIACMHIHQLGLFVQTEARVKELNEMNVKVQLVMVGKKGYTYFKRRPQYKIAGNPLGLKLASTAGFHFT